jgi:hypothetical protein
MLLLAFALFNARTERMAGMNALLFAAIIGLTGPLVYVLMQISHRRRTA